MDQLNFRLRADHAVFAVPGVSTRYVAVIVVTEKLATRIARQIAAEIHQQGWPVGHILGREADLVRRLKVSREPFREAVSILEMQGIVRMERGARGGLCVQAPAQSGVASMLRYYIEFADISFQEISAVHRLLGCYSCERAIARMTPAHANAMRRAATSVKHEYRSRDEEAMAIGALVTALLDVSGSPTLSMLMATLQRLVADFGHHERYPARVWNDVRHRMWQLSTRLAEHAARRDLAGSLEVMNTISDEVIELLAGLERRNPRIWNTRSFLGGSYHSAVLGRRVHGGVAVESRTPSRAIDLAYALMAEVRRKAMPAGTKLGSEAELTKRCKVGRSTLREAIRMLEFLGMARVQRGNDGGLVVSEQDPSLVIDSAVLFMMYVGPDPHEVEELLRRLAKEHGRVAAHHVAHRELLALREGVRHAIAHKSPSEQALPLFRQWALLADNRVLALIIEILATARAHWGPRASDSDVRAILEDVLARLEIAITEPSVDKLSESLSKLGQALQPALYAGRVRARKRSA